MILLTIACTPAPTPTLTEVVSSNRSTLSNEDGEFPDWIELFNDAEQPIDLSRHRIEVAGAEAITLDGLLEPGMRRVVFVDALEQSGDTLFVDDVAFEMPAVPVDAAWLPGRGFSWTPTPGAETSDAVVLADLFEPAPSVVRLNEVQVTNRSALVDEDGDYSDWIELVNQGSQPIELGGWTLSDTRLDPRKWTFPAQQIGPGEHLVVFASGKVRTRHANFKLNEQDVVVLGRADGRIVDLVHPTAPDDASFGREGLGWATFALPTPGEPNAAARLGSQRLRINEAVAVGRDWVELYNPGADPVSLEGWGFTDDPERPYRFTFGPDLVAPQEHRVIWLGCPDCRGIDTGFGLSPLGEVLQLTDAAGRVVDRLDTGRLVKGVSVGRGPDGQRQYFAKPTPRWENGPTGVDGYNTAPTFTLQAGYYDGPVTVEIVGDDVRYTIDGDPPHPWSRSYQGPITLKRTTVLRAASFSEGALPSPVATRTYLVDEPHNGLFTVALAADNDQLFDEETGMLMKGPDASPVFPYRGANFFKNIEVPVHIEMFEEQKRPIAALDAGLKVHGYSSRAMRQKSFRLAARAQYGKERIDVPLFADKPMDSYAGVILRTSGQDSIHTKFKDVLLTQLIKDSGLDYQGYRPTVVYLNGKYWGLYNLRERLDANYLVDNHGVDPERVTMLRHTGGWTDVGDNAEWFRLRAFIGNHSLRRKANNDYVASQIDLNSYADWLAIQVYYANIDNGNVRFWKGDRPGDKWKFVIYDTDACFEFFDHDTLGYYLEDEGGGPGALPGYINQRLLDAPEFRALFIRRLAFHMNHTLTTERVHARIDELAAVIEPELPRHWRRWDGNMGYWRHYVWVLRTFAKRRPYFVKQQVKEHLRLSREERALFDPPKPEAVVKE